MYIELTIKNVGEDLDFKSAVNSVGDFNIAIGEGNIGITWHGSIENTWLEETSNSITEIINYCPEVRIDLDGLGNLFNAPFINSTDAFILPIAINRNANNDDSGGGVLKAAAIGSSSTTMWYGIYNVEGSEMYYDGSIVITLDYNGEITGAAFTNEFPSFGSDSGAIAT